MRRAASNGRWRAPACRRAFSAARPASSKPRHCASADTVVAAIVGAAGLRPTLAAARAGKRILLANKEALVIGGAVFMGAVGAGRRDAAADRQRAQRDFPVPSAGLRTERRRIGRPSHPPHRLRRTVPAAAAGGTSRRDGGRSLCPSELGDGAQDQRRLRDHDEQGSRDDRSALAVWRAPGADRGRRAPGKRHPFAGRIR